MTLTDPTDDQLNAAFAEHVAGWKRLVLGGGTVAGHKLDEQPCWYDPATQDKTGLIHGKITAETSLAFTTGADAVLPWLEKMAGVEIHRAPATWHVYVTNDALLAVKNSFEDEPHGVWVGRSKSLPRAAVLALLAAHGVEVRFNYGTIAK